MGLDFLAPRCFDFDSRPQNSVAADFWQMGLDFLLLACCYQEIWIAVFAILQIKRT